MSEKDIRKRAAEWSSDPNPLHHTEDHHHRTAQECNAYAVEDRAALLLLLDDAREANDILRQGNTKMRGQVDLMVSTFLRGYPNERARLMAIGKAVESVRRQK